ncbi:MAG TPA: hypothetical protein VM677_27150 [Actinokineospora sp.]|jgi:hypothetical protein|nr:hypothetical protein [Actinokineospora sp.]
MTNTWKITAPVAAFTGDVAGCAFANGTYTGAASVGALNYFRGAGYTVEALDDQAAAAEPEPPHDPPVDNPTPAALPAKSAAKAEWVEAAVHAALAEEPGVDEAEARAKADAMTKDQLVELLTPKEEA